MANIYNTRENKQGFTLVELSIVLVIIGLLIGGILVGQNLIKSAKTQNLVRKLQQYEVAIQTFKGKFKSEPGDSGYFIPAGDNNGVHNSVGCHAISPYQGNEYMQVWFHLSQAQMISESYVGYQPIVCGGTHGSYSTSSTTIGITQPKTYNIEGLQNSWWGGDTDMGSIVYIVNTQARYFSLPLSAIDSFAIDKKLDDGNPETGSSLRGSNDGDPCELVDGAICYNSWFPDANAHEYF